MESRKRFDDIVARRVEPGDRAELDALVQQGQANDDAVARFEEYITLTADV
jgi:hypothetical protein